MDFVHRALSGGDFEGVPPGVPEEGCRGRVLRVSPEGTSRVCVLGSRRRDAVGVSFGALRGEVRGIGPGGSPTGIRWLGPWGPSEGGARGLRPREPLRGRVGFGPSGPRRSRRREPWASRPGPLRGRLAPQPGARGLLRRGSEDFVHRTLSGRDFGGRVPPRLATEGPGTREPVPEGSPSGTPPPVGLSGPRGPGPSGGYRTPHRGGPEVRGAAPAPLTGERESAGLRPAERPSAAAPEELRSETPGEPREFPGPQTVRLGPSPGSCSQRKIPNPAARPTVRAPAGAPVNLGSRQT